MMSNTTPSSGRLYYTNNATPPHSNTIPTQPRQSPRLLRLQADNQHLSPPSSNVLFLGHYNHNSITSSHTSNSSSLYSTASFLSSGSGSESNGHPIILFNSNTMTTAPTMAMAPMMATAPKVAMAPTTSTATTTTKAPTNISNRMQLPIASEAAGRNVKNKRKPVLPKTIHDELRRCIALKCMSIIPSRK
jgi:hypothetical protein